MFSLFKKKNTTLKVKNTPRANQTAPSPSTILTNTLESTDQSEQVTLLMSELTRLHTSNIKKLKNYVIDTLKLKPTEWKNVTGKKYFVELSTMLTDIYTKLEKRIQSGEYTPDRVLQILKPFGIESAVDPTDASSILQKTIAIEYYTEKKLLDKRMLKNETDQVIHNTIKSIHTTDKLTLLSQQVPTNTPVYFPPVPTHTPSLSGPRTRKNRKSRQNRRAPASRKPRSKRRSSA